MSDAAVCQVSDMIADALRIWPQLSGFTVVNELTPSQSADESDGDMVRIYLVGWTPQQPPEMTQTTHLAIFEIDVVTRDSSFGSFNRNAINAIAQIVACLGEDRTFGNQIQDIQELDVAGTNAEGKDTAGVSIQFRAEFCTPRTDWCSLIS